MTTQSLPEASSLKSWEDAFQYPLPTVRKLSTRLRRDIDEHRTRLRALVGASYRDLLGTADRIIDMDAQMQTVESSLGEIGRRCNTRMLERKDANFARLDKAWGQRGGEEARMASMAQCKILASTLGVVFRLVKGRGDALHAAKLMVLARLLYKSVSEGESVPGVLEQQRRSIASLRKKLLAYIDRSLAHSDVSKEELTNSLSAFALLSSSTSKDVLRHFLAVRVAKLQSLSVSPTPETILELLGLYTATIFAVQALFPKRIGEALATIYTAPLLSDSQIRKTEELNLDIYGRWIAEDIKTFTPWTRQDTFTASEGREALTSFGSHAIKILLNALSNCLSAVDDAATVLDVRKKVIGAYLSLGAQMAKVRGDGFQKEVNDLRAVFLSRLEELSTRAASLDDLSFAEGRENDLVDDSTTSSNRLWKLANDDVDASPGAFAFRSSILQLRNGYGPQLVRTIEPLDHWMTRLEEFRQCLDVMRATKWNEYLEHDLDDEDEEDEEKFTEQLSVDDVKGVEDRLRKETDEALNGAFARLQQAASELGSTRKAAYYLRTLRKLRQRSREVSKQMKTEGPNLQHGLDLSHNLHLELAEAIADKVVPAFETDWAKRQFVPLELWEGNPALPIQPLPPSFRLLATLQRSMAAVGEDLWSAEAVKVLKEALNDKLISVLEREPAGKLLNGHSEQKEVDKEGENRSQDDERNEDGAKRSGEIIEDAKDKEQASDEKESNEDGKKDDQTKQKQQRDEGAREKQQLQCFFDALYLARALGTNSKSKLRVAAATLQTRVGLQDGEVRRMEKSAVEYWKRTYLLFGLLAERQ